MIQNISNRNCIFEGHQEYQVTHICTFDDCKETTRWCCSECFKEELHNHKKSDNSHILNRKQILSRVMNQQQKVKKDYDQNKSRQANLFKKIINVCQKIEKSLLDYRNQYFLIDEQMQKMMSNFEKCLSNIQENNFQQIDNDKINLIINIQQYQFDEKNVKQQLQQAINDIKQQFYQIQIIIKEHQEFQENFVKKNQTSNSIINLKDRKYIIQEIDKTDKSYYASSISKNEQYLAYGGNDKLLKIYDIKQNKIIKQIELDDCICVCQFTQDSSKLYVGLKEGYMCGYDVQNDFKEIFKQQIHTSYIENIITIQNEYLITCSNDRSIIKTEIRRKKQMFKLTGHTRGIMALDYNDKDEIIVSSYYDKSIKLWNCRNKSIIINKEQSHDNDVRQIQLINNNLNILSLDNGGNLYKWQIDLKNKDLIKLQQFSDQNQIFNFYQVNQDQNLLLICNKYAKILNQYGETINTIEHGGKYSWYKDCRQLDNLKYIQIRTQDKIILATKQV